MGHTPYGYSIKNGCATINENEADKIRKLYENYLSGMALAKAAAIVPGQVLTNEEMNNLVDGLFGVSTPNYTPDGKTVLAVLKEEDIEKLFK